MVGGVVRKKSTLGAFAGTCGHQMAEPYIASSRIPRSGHSPHERRARSTRSSTWWEPAPPCVARGRSSSTSIVHPSVRSGRTESGPMTEPKSAPAWGSSVRGGAWCTTSRRPPGATRAMRCRSTASPSVRCNGRVEERDQVERAGLEPSLRQVGPDPLHLDVFLVVPPAGPRQRDPGHVQTRDPPPALRQPDGVGALPHPTSSALPGSRSAASVIRASLGRPLQTRSVAE